MALLLDPHSADKATWHTPDELIKNNLIEKTSWQKPDWLYSRISGRFAPFQAVMLIVLCNDESCKESTATPWRGFAKRKKNTKNVQNGNGNRIKSEVNCDVKHIQVTAS